MFATLSASGLLSCDTKCYTQSSPGLFLCFYIIEILPLSFLSKNIICLYAI